MADFNNSANMNLPIPVVGTTTGPEWASLLNSCLSIIDGHSHVAGSGVQITSAAININADLTIGGFNLTEIRSVRFSSNPATLALAADIGCLYEVGDDLYYNDGAGNQIRLTQAGSIVGTAGSITGLPNGTASASYNGVSQTFVWQSATNIAANLDAGSLVMRNLSPDSTYGLTLSPPAGLAANYALTLPALPASKKFMTLTNAGVMAADWAVDNSSLEVSSNTVQVKAQGITQAMLAPRTVATSAPAGGVARSASCGTSYSNNSSTPSDVDNLSVTLVTTGRPVKLMLVGDGTSASIGQGNVSLNVSSGSPTYLQGSVWFVRDGTAIDRQSMRVQNNTTVMAVMTVPGSSFQTLDDVAAGSHTYKVQANGEGGVVSIGFNRLKLVAYET